MPEAGFADSVETFTPETLTEIRTVSEACGHTSPQIFRQLDIPDGSVGVESAEVRRRPRTSRCTFSASSLADMLRELLPGCNLSSADDWIRKLSSIKTPSELERSGKLPPLPKVLLHRAQSQFVQA